MLNRSKGGIIYDLLSYGEVEVARKVKDTESRGLDPIRERAMRYACQPARKDGSGMLFGKAVALAAVEVMEGAPRELKWKRRSFKDVRRLYWSMLTKRERVVRATIRVLVVWALVLTFGAVLGLVCWLAMG
jgi:hypothetical protein